MKKFMVVANYNGKEVMRFVVTGIDTCDALSSAKAVIGNRYELELRVIT